MDARRYLALPSLFDRDYEDAPEPKGKAVAITFDGPVQKPLLDVDGARLGHSGLFTTGRAEMWRNAAVFTARTGGKCELFLHEFAALRRHSHHFTIPRPAGRILPLQNIHP